MNQTKWIPILSVALLLQLGLVIGLHSAERDRGRFVSDAPLLSFDAARVTALEIRAEDQTTELSKVDGTWSLPNYFDVPASSSRVEKLLERLASIRPGWPVGRSDEAAERFRVSEGEFERRLTLRLGDTESVTLFLGSSPGFRKVHARAGDSPEIYAIDLGAFEAPAKPSEWLDRGLLQLELANLERIDFANLSLQRASEEPASSSDGATDALVSEGPRFALTDLAEGEQTDFDATRTLADRIAKLRIRDVRGVESKPEYGLEQPLAQIKVYPRDGEVILYTIAKPSEGTDRILKVSTRPHFFGVSADTVEPLIAPDRSALLAKPEDAEAADGPADETGEKEASTDEDDGE